MKKLGALIACLAPIFSHAAVKLNYPDYFKNTKGCFLLYDVKAQKYVETLGDDHCKDRVPAASTFKVALSVMAFDSGVLKDENVYLKWDGKVDSRPEVNQDHNAKTWMRDSVVWFSQRLTPMLGPEKIQKYLNDFDYGNKDLSAGITMAWLVFPTGKTGALEISPLEQVEFMKKLWADKLPASKRAMRITRAITFLETSPKGFRLSGKTGSNFLPKDHKKALGWFISHVEGHGQEYIAVTNFIDLLPAKVKDYGGLRAKEITKRILTLEGLW